jgi:hypothetical protein
MSIDYDANFGIGFEIISFPEDVGLDAYEYMESILEDTKYNFITFGDSYQDEHYYAVCLTTIPKWNASEEEFLTFRKELIELYDFLINHGFKIKENSFLAGGLRVW